MNPDPLSIGASVVGLATAGIKLSTTLYTYSETVFRANRSVKEIAQDVSLTSSILRELGALLEQDSKEKVCSANALKTANDTVTSCQAVFDEINTALEKSVKKDEQGKSRVSVTKCLKWPLKEPKMKLLQGNLDRLKGTLVLILNVVTYARKLAVENADKRVDDDQRLLIQNLIDSNKESAARYEALQNNRPTSAFNTMLGGVPENSFHTENFTTHNETAREIRPTIRVYATARSSSNDIVDHRAQRSREVPRRARARGAELESLPCICGQPSDDFRNQAPEHITLESLRQCERQLSSIIDDIDGAQQNLLAVGFDPVRKCTDIFNDFEIMSKVLNELKLIATERKGAMVIEERISWADQNEATDFKTGNALGFSSVPGKASRGDIRKIQQQYNHHQVPEAEITDELENISSTMSQLRKLALATGEELGIQNDLISQIQEKVDKVDKEVAHIKGTLNRPLKVYPDYEDEYKQERDRYHTHLRQNQGRGQRDGDDSLRLGRRVIERGPVHGDDERPHERDYERPREQDRVVRDNQPWEHEYDETRTVEPREVQDVSAKEVAAAGVAAAGAIAGPVFEDKRNRDKKDEFDEERRAKREPDDKEDDRERRYAEGDRDDRNALDPDEEYRQRVQQAELELTGMRDHADSDYERRRKDRCEREDKDEHEQVPTVYAVEATETYPGEAVDQLLREWTNINISGVEGMGH